MEKHKIAVIGCGYVSNDLHFPAYTSMPNVELVACDIDQDRLREMAHKFNIQKTYSDAEEMLRKERPDVTVIAVPPNLHRKYVEMGIRYKQHILVEKPLVPSLKDADELIRLTKDYDRKIMVDENFRWFKDYQAVKEFIAKGFIGDAYWVKIETLRDHVNEDPSRTGWVYKSSRRWLYEDGIHWIDLLRFWLEAEAEKVFAHFPQPPHVSQEKGDNFDVVHIIYKENKAATIIQNCASKGSYKTEVRVEGSEGSITAQWKGAPEWKGIPMSTKETAVTVYSKRHRSVIHPVLEDIGHYWSGHSRVVMEYFLDCIEKDKQPMTNLKEDREALEVLFAAYESAEKGCVVKLKSEQ